MANQLGMAKVHTILTLRGQGWSFRRIGRELGIRRETVSRYVRLAESQATHDEASDQTGAKAAKPAPRVDSSTPPTGAVESGQGERVPGAVPVGRQVDPVGSAERAPGPGEPEAVARQEGAPVAVPPVVPACAGTAGRSGPASACAPFHEVIDAKLELGLSAKRIHQDLVAEHGFAASYYSVKRFCRWLKHTRPLPFRRMECAPGAEAQIDFGKGAPVVRPNERPRRTHVFRIVLSHSRKAYSEAVFRQTTDDFIRCLENAFWHFGGVPKTLVPDNLKAAVIKADWFDPDLNPKLQAFAEHYGTAILPTKPRTPRHKGKVERSVDYAQENGLKGHTFTSLVAENRHLLHWETTVADTRIHGTTRKQVGKLFEEIERPALLPLPVERFPFFHEERRKVHRDGHVEVAKAYYSVPPEYLGCRLWVRWDGHLVRIFSDRMEPITVHSQQEPGRFSTQNQHIAAEKISGVERGAAWLLGRAALIGSATQRWAEGMLQARGVQGVRVLQGLLSLSNRYADLQIDQACEIAQSHGAYRLRVIRELIKRQAPKQEQFEFTQDHPIIRSLSEYSALVHAAVQQDPPVPIQECCP